MCKFQQTGYLIDIAGDLILRGERGDYKFLEGQHRHLLGKKVNACVCEPEIYKPWNAAGWIYPESIQVIEDSTRQR